MVENKNILRYVAGGVFAICGLIYVIHLINSNASASIRLPYVIGYFLISASIFTSKSILRVIGCAFLIISDVRVFAIDFDYLLQAISNFWWNDIIWCLATLISAVGWTILLITALNKKKMPVLYFVLIGISVVHFISIVIGYTQYYSVIESVIEVVKWQPDNLLIILGFTLMVLFEKNYNITLDSIETNCKDMDKASSKLYNNKLESQVDRIEKLKKLLDNGIITKEEFDNKKKQILGL